MSYAQAQYLPILSCQPGFYMRNTRWQIKGTVNAADRYTLLGPSVIGVNIDTEGYAYVSTSPVSLDLSQASSWDTTSPTNYTVATNRLGQNFYAYACKPSSGTVPVFLLSANSTYPYGYDATTSRKIAGFHCMPGDVGTISGHPYSGFVTGDIMINSVWDLKWRPACDTPEGMVYDPGINKWVDIYLASLIGGTGDPYGVPTRKVASVYGATIYATDTFFNFVQRGINSGKRLPTYTEFMSLASGSNEQTAIDIPGQGSVHPGTTGWWRDTAGRAMISHVGVIGACGAIWQRGLGDFGFNRIEGATPSTVSGTASATESGKLVDGSTAFDDRFIGCVLINTTDSTWAMVVGRDGSTKLLLSSNIMESGESYTIYKTSQAFMQPASWKALTGSKGGICSYGSNNPVVPQFGGCWSDHAACGSRCATLLGSPWSAVDYVGVRFLCDHLYLT